MAKLDSEKSLIRRRWKTTTVVAVIVVVVLALVLGLALGLRHQQASGGGSTNSTQSNAAKFVTRNEQEWVLSGNNFTTSSMVTTRYYEFNVSQMLGAPDGYQRTMLVVNGQYPGPLIECNTGDRLVIKVNNQLDSGTAIHWHGMFQNGTNWMDGTVGVTQCPIPPGGSFTYNFTVPNQHGTYWWHSHMGSQYADGIVGSLIIQDPNEGLAEDYDKDVIVMLSDWYHDMSPVNTAIYLTAEADGSEPVPENGVINGLNVFDCSKSANSSVPCTGGSYASFQVQPNKRYRFRLINTGAFADFNFSIDNHTLTVIETDGIAMTPVNVTRLPIAVAQRYSVIVNTNAAVDNYWIRAVMNQHCFAYTNPALNPDVMAVLRYQGANSTSDPTTVDNNLVDPATCNDLNQTMLVPHVPLDAPEPNVSYYFEVSFQTLNAALPKLAYMNTTTWIPLNSTTTLQEAHSTTGNITTFGQDQYVVTPPSNASVIQIAIQSFDDGDHPFHLHGHVFWVMGTGDGYVQNPVPVFNSTNPLRRDTVTIPAYGWAVIRVQPNPAMQWQFYPERM
ncbi:hypothetical protein BZG36_00484 [Bifiguratus adelaidae]|uniref:Laccase n=1 Tax=Bifiguratus adelaidae TaxID=1938954 RepID=A0A261Y7H8_9FUNG|nr:hypothetical protein BZG36_00484 [Bifiguratus adelaidae]